MSLSASADAGFPLCLPLQVRDELADRDLLRHLVVEILTVEHHGLQDGEGPLQHRRVHGRLVHVAGDLPDGKGEKSRQKLNDARAGK